MYNCQIKKYLSFWIVFTLWLFGYVLWIDLTSQISTKFKETYDLWLADEYLNIPYNKNFSKDPFGEAMDIYTWMAFQTKVAWVKYVEKALELKWCSLSKEKQWAIEYYFLPEFRWELVRVIKIEMGDYENKNYTFDEEIIMDYCTEFYNCTTRKLEWGAGNSDRITAWTPENIKTNCKEFFQTNYREWQAEEKRVQNLQIAWLWNDKYVNATTEESPYDVMTDLGVVWELSYLQAKRPVTPVFFDISAFEKSKETLLNEQNGWGNDCVEETYGWVVQVVEGVSLWWSEKSLAELSSFKGADLWWNDGWAESNFWLENLSNLGWNNWRIDQSVSIDRTAVDTERLENNVLNWIQNLDWSVKPLSRNKSVITEYNTLVEWLGGYKLNDGESTYYWSLCEDENEEPEAEFVYEEEKTVSRDDVVWTETFDLSKAEYQELVDYMLDAVTSYTSLSEDKEAEIKAKAGSVGEYNRAATTSWQIEAVAKKILNCYQSCVWLNVDGQFACMLKCSCGEIKSPIFDPDVNPGMWPIFMIKYCAVPAVNPRYFYWGSDGTDSWSSTLVWRGSSSNKGKFVKRWELYNWWWNNWRWNSWWWNSWWWSSWRWNSWWWNSWWWNSWWWSSWWWTCSTNEWNPNAREEIWSSFNVGWTRMVSMEKWINEILWVVEKLAREWRLWTWTQQYNFLDSTTKLMDVADTFSFTVSANKRKISEKVWEPNDEYLIRTFETTDNNWLVVNHVANPLDNPATRNYYLLVGEEWEVVWDISASTNADVARQSQWYLNVAPWFIVDQSENSNAARYAKISELFGNWLDEQWDFWADKVEYLKEMDEYAKALYAKKW